jgi:hypothetical protein
MLGPSVDCLTDFEAGRVVCDLLTAHGFCVWASFDHVVFDISTRQRAARGFVIPRSEAHPVVSEMKNSLQSMQANSRSSRAEVSCSAGTITVEEPGAHGSRRAYGRFSQDGNVEQLDLGHRSVDMSYTSVRINLEEVETISRSLSLPDTTVHGPREDLSAEWYRDL